MLLMDYSSIRGEDFADYAKPATWILLHVYIDTLRQSLIYEYTGYGVKTITIFKYQCKNTTFNNKTR